MSVHVCFTVCLKDVNMSVQTPCLQKIQERKAALEKMTFTDSEELEKWRLVVKAEFMSSDESATDEDDEVIVVKQLPWRSVHVGQMFRHLDDKGLKEKSPQARRQMKRRVKGHISNCPRPIGDIPSWAVTDN